MPESTRELLSYSSLFPEPVVLRLLHPPRLLLLLLPPPPLLLLLPPSPLLLLPPPPLLLPLNEGGRPELLLAESQLLELLLGLGPRVLDFFNKKLFYFPPFSYFTGNCNFTWSSNLSSTLPSTFLSIGTWGLPASLRLFSNSRSLLSFCSNMFGRLDGVVRDLRTRVGVGGALGC